MNWDDVAYRHGTDKSATRPHHNGHNYMPHYQRILDRPEFTVHTTTGRIVLLEIGVLGGASLRMWHELMPYAQLYGVDIDLGCARNIEGAAFIHADQSNRTQMELVAEKYGPFSVVIDDGSHDTDHVLTTYHALAPHTTHWYFIEDLTLSQCERIQPWLTASARRVELLPSGYPDGMGRQLIVIQPNRSATNA